MDDVDVVAPECGVEAAAVVVVEPAGALELGAGVDELAAGASGPLLEGLICENIAPPVSVFSTLDIGGVAVAEVSVGIASGGVAAGVLGGAATALEGVDVVLTVVAGAVVVVVVGAVVTVAEATAV